MKKILVVFYSRTGITRKIAEAIARYGDCDLEAISDGLDRTGMLGYWRCGYEALTKKCPDIVTLIHDPADYAVVVVGTPVWASHMASPIRSFVVGHGGEFKSVAAFCTMGGSGGEAAVNEIGALCGKSLAARMVLTDRQISDGQYREQLEKFAATLERKVLLPAG